MQRDFADELATSLSRLNERYRSPKYLAILAAASFVLTFCLFLTHTEMRYGLNSVPVWALDEMDYDSIGWELAQGSGFQLEFTDPEFAAPYIEGGVASRIPRRKGPQIMTYRPPLLPLLAAGGNRFFGRQFYGVRLINTAVTAGVCALVVWTVSRMMGPLPALIALINFMLVDERTRVYARSLYTESLGAFVVAITAFLLIAHAKRPRVAVMVGAGMTMGLGVLTRNIFALWLPVLAAWIVWWRPRDVPFVRRLYFGGTFLAVALLVMSPWMIRNVRLLRSLQPLGTQARMDAASGYSDRVFAQWGEWQNLYGDGEYDSILGDAAGVEWEKRLASESVRRARVWMIDNWYKLPILAAMKVVNEFRPYRFEQAYLSAFALLGLIAMRRRPEASVSWVLIIAATISIAATWSVQGRFVVPLMFVFHVFAAIGLWISTIASMRGPDTAQCE